MIIELMIQHYLTSPNIKNIIKLRKIAYLGAKFFLAPCFFMLVCAISWEQRKVKDIADNTYGGGTPQTSIDSYWNGEIPWIQSQDIIENHLFNVEPRKHISEEAISKSATKLVPKNSIAIVTRVGVGKLAFMPFSYCTSQDFLSLSGIQIDEKYATYSIYQMLQKEKQNVQGTSIKGITIEEMLSKKIPVPCNSDEQGAIGAFFHNLDTLITLHQREPPKEDKILNDIKTDTLFHEYYCQWLVIYKEGSVRGVTMQKYHLTAEWVKKLIPDVKLCDFDRITYQQLINDYAETHERQTTMDFHHQLKGAILDAVDDGLIARDPTRKVIIKGKSPNDKKKKYLSRYELQKLLTSLDLNSGLNMDWLILLIAKTGMRFSEAIAVTPMDFDFTHQTLSVNKTWDYKGEGGFQPTKNKSSVRKIRLDWQTVGQFYAIVRELNDTAPIFVSKEKKIYNSTLNDVLERHCKAVGIPTISVHGLRHTHASLLLFDGVSIASVAQRLGHSSINTTQKTYLHIIRELENKDIDLIMKSISSLLD